MKAKKYSLFDNLRYVIGFCWQNDRVLFALCILNTLFEGVMPFVGVLLPKYLIDDGNEALDGICGDLGNRWYGCTDLQVGY